MPNATAQTAQDRINQQIEFVKHEYGNGIVNLLKETNKTRLQSKGKLTLSPTQDRNSLRWTLAWKENKISFELNVVFSLTDNGAQARIDRVWVHRHASAPFDFEGHTPTTHMHRLTSLSLAEIKSAIEAEFR